MSNAFPQVYTVTIERKSDRRRFARTFVRKTIDEALFAASSELLVTEKQDEFEIVGIAR